MNKYVHEQINFPDTRIWYKDSIVIEELMAMRPGVADSQGFSRIDSVYPLYYAFIDMRTNISHVYTNFTDTAICIKISDLNIEVADKTIGNAFWKYTKESIAKTAMMTDTLMDGILYKRIKYLGEGSKGIQYARCDKKGTFFQMNKRLSEKIGCPITISEYIVDLPSGRRTGTKMQYVFFADTLSREELKIFKAWGKNAGIINSKTNAK